MVDLELEKLELWRTCVRRGAWMGLLRGLAVVCDHFFLRQKVTCDHFFPAKFYNRILKELVSPSLHGSRRNSTHTCCFVVVSGIFRYGLKRIPQEWASARRAWSTARSVVVFGFFSRRELDIGLWGGWKNSRRPALHTKPWVVRRGWSVGEFGCVYAWLRTPQQLLLCNSCRLSRAESQNKLNNSISS